jgi:hypothetical protein
MSQQRAKPGSKVLRASQKKLRFGLFAVLAYLNRRDALQL